MHIHEEMEPKEINQILEEHYKLNDDILERASRAKSKEYKEYRGTGTGFSQTQGQKLGTTLKKAIGAPKSITSTANNGFRGKNKSAKKR